MFRSLLNTLPVLSGNFTIACKLNNISKKSNENFDVYVYEASLKPLDDNVKLYKSVAVNLMNGKYSFDLKKYSSIIDIHKGVYKNNYTTFVDIDKTLPIDDRNKIYEYGCKRISYKYHKNEWSFYAPFYINNFDEIPDYFVIEVHKKNSSQVLKKIKIYIGQQRNENKLYYYLKRHIEQIENNIPITWQYNNKEIIIHNAIDYKNGVIMSRTIDSNSQIFYHNHVTINEFDSMINNLYYDNGFILSEVIPLSFEFTLSDFLEKSEYRYYQMNDFTITGYYVKNNNKMQLYVFDTNSHNLMLSYKEYDNNEIVSKQYNLYDKNGNNSLHEATNVLLRNNNTISKQYCKWVNYDDENYYINNNISYSTDYGKYGTFPIFKNLASDLLKLKVDFIDNKLNAWVPNSEYFEYDFDIYSRYSLDNECVVYNNLKINNISSWFEILSDNNNNFIFNDTKKWSIINKFNNYCFYKGIMYKNLPEDIDYFGVFLKLNIKDISNSKVANILINSYSTDSTNISTYSLYNDVQNKSKIDINSYINETIVTSDNINTIKENISNGEQYYKFVSEDNEWYMDYDDINSNSNLKYIRLNNGFIYDSFDNQFVSNSLTPIVDIIHSYELLENLEFSDIYNYYINFYKDESDNVILEKFGDIYYLDVYSGQKKNLCNNFLLNSYDKNTLDEYLNKNISKIFRKKSFVHILKKQQIYDIVTNIASLVQNIEGSFEEYFNFDYLINKKTLTTSAIKDIKNRIKNFVENFADKEVFINDNVKYINKIKNYLLYYLHFYINNSIDKYQLYYYKFDTSITSLLVVDYFRKYDNKLKNGSKVYIDSYNIKKIFSSDISIHSMQDSVFYCKFINLDHFKEYCKKLYTNDVININISNQKDLLDTIYCKRTIIYLNKDNEFELINYISLLRDHIYQNDSNTNNYNNILDKLLNNITYNDDKFFINIGKIKSYDNADEFIACELYYKKQLVELTSTLLNALKNIKIPIDNLNNISGMEKYMYYYSKNNEKIYKSAYYAENVKRDKKEDDIETEKSEDKFLSPIFESVYLNYDNGNNFAKINNLFLSSLENTLYVQNNPKSSIYKLVNAAEIEENDILYNKIQVNYAEIETTENDNGEISKIHTYTNKETGKKYGYFIINEYLSNNTDSYNIEDVMYDKLTLSLVNNKPFSKNIFLDIYPFIKNDIFLDICQQIKEYIVYPTHVKLKNVYKAVYINNDKNTSIIQNNQTQYLYLNRYFANIMPSLKLINSNIPDMYKKIYKVKNCNFANDNNLLSYIQIPCNIYRNQPIFYIENFHDLENNNYVEFIPQENKHFMDNLLYHLPKNIEYTVPTNITITYNDIKLYEDVSDIKTSKIFEYFKQYIKNSFYKKIVNNNEENIETLLFLFKMYSYIVEKNIIKYDMKLNNKLYSITYKLTLK